MTKRDMANLLLKAFSIYSFLLALQILPYFLNDILKLSDPSLPFIFQAALPTLSMMLAGILLWVMSYRGAKIIFGREDNDYVIHASIQDIQVVAFSLAGLYLITNAVPALLNPGIFYVWFIMNGQKTDGMASMLIVPFIRLCIGFWLLFGSRGIVVFIKKMRRAGEIGSHNPAAQ